MKCREATVPWSLHSHMVLANLELDLCIDHVIMNVRAVYRNYAKGGRGGGANLGYGKKGAGKLNYSIM